GAGAATVERAAAGTGACSRSVRRDRTTRLRSTEPPAKPMRARSRAFMASSVSSALGAHGAVPGLANTNLEHAADPASTPALEAAVHALRAGRHALHRPGERIAEARALGGVARRLLPAEEIDLELPEDVERGAAEP